MPHRGAVNRGPASLQGWVIVVASFHKLQLIVVHVYSKHFKADIQI